MKRALIPAWDEYLNLERTAALKGLLAIAVLVAHAVPASGVFGGSKLAPLIGFLGYLGVAAFFFLSGYGIMTRFQERKEQYLKGFLKNRVLSVYCLTVFLIILYGSFRVLMRIPFSASEVVQSFVIGNTIVSNGWYLQIIILFYLLWYAVTKYIQNEQLWLPVLCAAVLGYMLLGMLFLQDFWTQSSLGFLMGVYWRKNKAKVDVQLLGSRGRVFVTLTVAAIGFLTTFIFAKRMIAEKLFVDAMLIKIFRFTMSSISAAFFVVVILTLSIVLEKIINCGILRFLGTYSMEIYVLQGVPLHVFKEGRLAVENGWLYITSVFAATILLAVVLHPVVRFVTNIPKKYLQRGSENG